LVVISTHYIGMISIPGKGKTASPTCRQWPRQRGRLSR
jgi:hypothetical protein